MRRDVGVLIPAAGSGERAGAGEPKQFRPIGGVPMLLRAVRPFASHARVREVVVALPPTQVSAPPAWLADHVGHGLKLVAGGETRAASVRAALGALDSECTIVLVHDAARPFVSAEVIDRVIATAGTGDGAVPVLPVTDTLKRASGEQVVETVSRDGLWRAQTPQGFPRVVLENAYRRAAGTLKHTDDAALVEAAGNTVRLVPGDARNFKVTTPDDFAVAEGLAGS